MQNMQPTIKGDHANEFQVRKTKNYSLFKFIDDNRQITEEGIKNLVEAISNDNFLHLCPIIVDSNYYIIDGQHRLIAAEKLGVPIFYVVDDQYKPGRLITMNNTRKNWEMEDYLNFYVAHGYEDYIKLQDFMREKELTLRTCLIWMRGVDTRSRYKDFKTGKFRFQFDDVTRKALDSSIQLIRLMKDRNFTPKMTFLEQIFQTSLKQFFTNPLVVHEQFFDRYEKASHLLRRSPNVNEYLKCFIDIYNYRMRENTLKLTQNKKTTSITA